jgi:hypothetical protein
MPQQQVSRPRTSTLFRRIFKAADLKDYLDENETVIKNPNFSEYISKLCCKMNDKKESVINRSSIERTYGHQLFNGTRKPSRDKVIQLAFGFRLDLEGTQKLLQEAEKSLLYPRIKRDAAIIYCIDHKCGVIETQTMLHELGLNLLGDE